MSLPAGAQKAQRPRSPSSTQIKPSRLSGHSHCHPLWSPSVLPWTDRHLRKCPDSARLGFQTCTPPARPCPHLRFQWPGLTSGPRKTWGVLQDLGVRCFFFPHRASLDPGISKSTPCSPFCSCSPAGYSLPPHSKLSEQLCPLSSGHPWPCPYPAHSSKCVSSSTWHSSGIRGASLRAWPWAHTPVHYVTDLQCLKKVIFKILIWVSVEEVLGRSSDHQAVPLTIG